MNGGLVAGAACHVPPYIGGQKRGGGGGQVLETDRDRTAHPVLSFAT